MRSAHAGSARDEQRSQSACVRWENNFGATAHAG
jgi:hypothetical protein